MMRKMCAKLIPNKLTAEQTELRRDGRGAPSKVKMMSSQM